MHIRAATPAITYMVTPSSPVEGAFPSVSSVGGVTGSSVDGASVEGSEASLPQRLSFN